MWASRLNWLNANDAKTKWARWSHFPFAATKTDRKSEHPSPLTSPRPRTHIYTFTRNSNLILQRPTSQTCTWRRCCRNKRRPKVFPTQRQDFPLALTNARARFFQRCDGLEGMLWQAAWRGSNRKLKTLLDGNIYTIRQKYAVFSKLSLYCVCWFKARKRRRYPDKATVKRNICAVCGWNNLHFVCVLLSANYIGTQRRVIVSGNCAKWRMKSWVKLIFFSKQFLPPKQIR